MSEVKRYTESCMEGGGVAPDYNGEFVEWKDYEKLRAELAALKAGQGEAVAYAQVNVVDIFEYDTIAVSRWVEADDHVALEAERDELREQVEALRAALDGMVAACGSLEYEAGYMDAARRSAEDVLEALQAKP